MVVDTVVGGPSLSGSRQALARETGLAAPTHLLAEVTSAVRGLVLRRHTTEAQGRAAVLEARALRIRQFPFGPFVERIWELRENVTVYDAWYVALAEALDVPLLTADRRLADAPGARCEVRLVRS